MMKDSHIHFYKDSPTSLIRAWIEDTHREEAAGPHAYMHHCVERRAVLERILAERKTEALLKGEDPG